MSFLKCQKGNPSRTLKQLVQVAVEDIILDMKERFGVEFIGYFKDEDYVKRLYTTMILQNFQSKEEKGVNTK